MKESVLRAKAIKDDRLRQTGPVHQVRFDTGGLALPTKDRPPSQRESGTLRARERAGDDLNCGEKRKVTRKKNGKHAQDKTDRANRRNIGLCRPLLMLYDILKLLAEIATIEDPVNDPPIGLDTFLFVSKYGLYLTNAD